MEIKSDKILSNILAYLTTAKEEARRYNPSATSVYLEDIKSTAYMLDRPDLAFLADYIIKMIDDLDYLEVFNKFRKSKEYRDMLETSRVKNEELKEFLSAFAMPMPKEYDDFINGLIKSIESIEEFIKKDEGFGSAIASLIDLMRYADRLERSQRQSVLEFLLMKSTHLLSRKRRL